MAGDLFDLCESTTGPGMTALLQTPHLSPAAWRGQEMSRRTDWTIDLSGEQIDELRSATESLSTDRRDLQEVGPGDLPLPGWRDLIEGLRQDLEGGRGFAMIRSLPVDDLPLDAARWMLWAIGQHLGHPEPQDAALNVMHDVRDTGKDLRADNIRAYQTRLPINYHNDGADSFMLLCYRAAGIGGGSKLVSAITVFNTILERRPDLAAVLQSPFDFDARGQQRPGAPAYQRVPIYSWFADHLSVLYKREYIDLAQRFPDVPALSSAQIEALDLMDEVCEELSMEFQMQPGDIVVANNYDILHARSGFEAAPVTDEARHMLRLWLSLPNGRPLPPVFAETREFCHSYAWRQTQ